MELGRDWLKATCGEQEKLQANKHKQTNKQASKQNRSKQWCRDGQLRHLGESNNETIKSEGTHGTGGREGADFNIAPRTRTPTPSLLLLSPPCCVIGGAASAVRYEGRPWPRSAAHTTARMFSSVDEKAEKQHSGKKN
jgi:hypothetical protein